MPQRSPDPGEAARADLAACRATLHAGSRSFHAASLLLPRRVRDPASAVYAFCRAADDAVDLGDGGPDAVTQLRERLALAYAGRPLPLAPDRALARVAAEHALPRALPEALLEGLAWDAEGRRYEDFAALTNYAVRVAGTVGVMMAVLMGSRAPSALARACDLGVAMQLSNIARDVGEDARAGRLYLPLAWLREAGIDPDAWLARPVFNAALGGVVERLLRVADALYERADAGIAALPLACRPGIAAARLLYAEIGREVERAGFDSVSARARVAASRKARLLGRGVLAAVRPAPDRLAPPLEQGAFLVVAAMCPDAARARGRERPQNLDERVAWVCELFMQLKVRDQAMSRPGA
jgi:phytoene synthase